MAECLFVTSTLILTLSFIATGIAFFAPFWLSGNVDRGLWGYCRSGQCEWFWTNDFQWGKNLPDWHIAAMVLYGVGFLIVFVTEIYSRLQLCCELRASMSRSAGFLLVAAFVLMGVGIGVYGGMANKDFGAEIDFAKATHLGWAFWMAVAGSVLTLLTGLMFICVTGFRCGGKS